MEKFPLAVDLDGRRAVGGVREPGHDDGAPQELARNLRPLLEALGRTGFALTLLHVSARPEIEESAARELERAAGKLGSGDPEEAEMERIRNAIRACTEESLESVGGLSQALETVRKINARRAREDAATPVQVTTRTWTSTRIADQESGE